MWRGDWPRLPNGLLLGANYFAGVPVSKHITTNRFGYNASSAYRYIITDGNTRQDYTAAADPNIVSNRHRGGLRCRKWKTFIHAFAIVAKSPVRAYRMKNSIYMNARSD